MRGVDRVALHVISSSGVGGAEQMLYKLLKYQSFSEYTNIVVVLAPPGDMHYKFVSVCKDTYSLNISRTKIPDIRNIGRVIMILSRSRSVLIQGWMYHGNLFGTLLFLFKRRNTRLLWSIRQTLYSMDNEKCLTRFVIRLGKMFSQIPEAIIYNSIVSMRQHENFGFCSANSVYSPNFFEIPKARDIRKHLSVSLERQRRVITLAHIARWHPMKGHFDFLRVARELDRQSSRYCFLMAGKDVDDKNDALTHEIFSLGLNGKVKLLGLLDDIPTLLKDTDGVVLTSHWGEAFPNVLGEAVARGIKGFSTNVGDCASILGDATLPEPGDVIGLSKKIQDWFDGDERERRIQLITQYRRMRDKYSPESVISKFNEIYSE